MWLVGGMGLGSIVISAATARNRVAYSVSRFLDIIMTDKALFQWVLRDFMPRRKFNRSSSVRPTGSSVLSEITETVGGSGRQFAVLRFVMTCRKYSGELPAEALWGE